MLNTEKTEGLEEHNIIKFLHVYMFHYCVHVRIAIHYK